MIASKPESPDSRSITPAVEAACYATGFLSLGLVPMMLLAVPLWAISLGASPFAIGLIVGMGAAADLFGLQGTFIAVTVVLVLIFVAMGLLARRYRL